MIGMKTTKLIKHNRLTHLV